MPRSTLPSLAAMVSLTVLVGFGVAAPVPTHLLPEWVPYYPTRVGDTWTMQYESDDENTRTYTVTAVEGKDRAKTVTVGRVERNGEVTMREKLLVSDTGVFRLQLYEKKLNTPLPLLRLPLRPKEKWPIFIAEPRDMDVSGSALAREPEEVDVPAGKFLAIAVEAKYRFGNEKPREDTLWFAPEVGIVVEGGKEAWVMKSFTRGKR